MTIEARGDIPAPQDRRGGLARRVAVVSVTYNAAQHVGAMLDSIRGSSVQVSPVIVVDNGSRDRTRELIRDERWVQLIEQGNTGYADGVNTGIDAAPPEHDILVLNPDVVVGSRAIEHLLAVFEQHEDVAVVVPMLNDDAGSVHPSLRRRPSWWRTLVEAVVGGSRAGRFGEAYRPDPKLGRQQTDWATGAAMLIRREVLDQLGLWDPSFFLYSEETEFCLRVACAGYRVVCEPRAVVRHTGGEMAYRPELWALRAVNRIRLQRRSGWMSAAALRVTSVLFELRRVVAGETVSRAAVRALLSRDLDATAATLTRRLGGELVDEVPRV